MIARENTKIVGDKCWFRGGCISNDMMNMVRGVLTNGYEMSDETVLSICAHMGFYEDKGQNLSSDVVASKLDYKLETTINRYNNNRGNEIALERDDDVFMLNMLGYENYKRMSETVRDGGMVRLAKAEDDNGRIIYGIKTGIAKAGSAIFWENLEEPER